MNRIYLDYNATTAVEPAVLDAMLPFFSTDFGNASSIHTFGQRARAAVENARDQVAALLHARSQEIVFTSGGTESDNQAIFGIVAATASPTKHIIISTIEHEAVLNACQALEKQGVAVTYLPVSVDGLVDLDELRKAIRPDTVLISIMHANNELGAVQPLAEIGRIAAEADLYFHTDAVQSARSSSRAARVYASFSSAATTSVASAPARKMSPALSVSAKPPNSRFYRLR